MMLPLMMMTMMTMTILHCILKGLYKQEEDNSYNAFEKDIAVVHFFFQVMVMVIFLMVMVVLVVNWW